MRLVDDWKNIQRLVGVTPDGSPGPKTGTAILDELFHTSTTAIDNTAIWKDIQGRLGLKQDGIPGQKTATAILHKLEESREEECPATPSLEDITHKDKYVPAIKNTYDKIVKVIATFETGYPTGHYDDVTILKDGGKGAYYQITYGRMQTTQDGNLDTLLKNYIAAKKGNLTAEDRYINSKIPTKTNRSLYSDKTFIAALKTVGKLPIMANVQDEFFDTVYFSKAYTWFKNNGFTLPLSMLVIFDSFIHSGRILDFLRKRFSEVPPAKGGGEKEWIQAYIRVRRDWLANHSNKVLRNTVYRMDCFLDLIKKNDWALTGKINAHGTIIV